MPTCCHFICQNGVAKFSSLMQSGLANSGNLIPWSTRRLLPGLCPKCSGSGATLPWSAWQQWTVLQKLAQSHSVRRNIPQSCSKIRLFQSMRVTILKMRIQQCWPNCVSNHHRRTFEHWHPRRIISWHILTILRSPKIIKSPKRNYPKQPRFRASRLPPCPTCSNRASSHGRSPNRWCHRHCFHAQLLQEDHHSFPTNKIKVDIWWSWIYIYIYNIYIYIHIYTIHVYMDIY